MGTISAVLYCEKAVSSLERKKWIAQYHVVSQTPLNTHQVLKDQIESLQQLSRAVPLSEVRIDK